MSIINDIADAVEKGKVKDIKVLVPQAIEEGLSAQTILNDGLLAGMNVIGGKFTRNEAFVPEVLVSARAMNKGTELIKPLLVQEGTQPIGKVCLGTVEGDLHDIGKNIVRMMLEGKNIEVIDLGTDVPVAKFIETATEENCQIICMSALLTTTMPVMKAVVDAAVEAGIRDKVKIMIGGAPVTEEYCKQINADVYTEDAATCANEAARLLQE